MVNTHAILVHGWQSEEQSRNKPVPHTIAASQIVPWLAREALECCSPYIFKHCPSHKLSQGVSSTCFTSGDHHVLESLSRYLRQVIHDYHLPPSRSPPLSSPTAARPSKKAYRNTAKEA